MWCNHAYISMMGNTNTYCQSYWKKITINMYFLEKNHTFMRITDNSHWKKNHSYFLIIKTYLANADITILTQNILADINRDHLKTALYFNESSTKQWHRVGNGPSTIGWTIKPFVKNRFRNFLVSVAAIQGFLLIQLITQVET